MTMLVVKKEREIRENNRRLAERVMDLRDQRICLQRKVLALEDKEFWEPEEFTSSDRYWLLYYRADIARIKAEEEELRHRMII